MGKCTSRHLFPYGGLLQIVTHIMLGLLQVTLDFHCCVFLHAVTGVNCTGFTRVKLAYAPEKVECGRFNFFRRRKLSIRWPILFYSRKASKIHAHYHT